MVSSFDLMHVVMAVAGVAITLVYQKYAVKPAPASPSSPSTPPAPDGSAPVIIPGRPILTMLLSMLHNLVDSQAGDPNPLTPLALLEKSAPLDLQTELLTLVNKLRGQPGIAAPSPPATQPSPAGQSVKP